MTESIYQYGICSICTTVHHWSPSSLSLLYTLFVPQFVLYLYCNCITTLYYICTTVCTVFVLYLYHNPPQESYLPFRWPLSPFLIRLVLLGSLTHCYPPFYLYFARGLLEVQRRHNVYRLL